MVLPVDGPRRLLPLHHRLEAVHHHEGRGRHRHARDGARCFRGRQSQGAAPAKVAVRQRLLLPLGGPGQMDEAPRHRSRPRRSLPPDDPGQNRALAPDPEEPHPAGELLSARRSGKPDRDLRDRLQQPPLSREHRQPHPSRRLLRTRSNHPAGKRKDQTQNYPNSPIDTPQPSRLTSNPDAPDPLLNQAAPCLKISDDGQSSAPVSPVLSPARISVSSSLL